MMQVVSQALERSESVALGAVCTAQRKNEQIARSIEHVVRESVGKLMQQSIGQQQRQQQQQQQQLEQRQAQSEQAIISSSRRATSVASLASTSAQLAQLTEKQLGGASEAELQLLEDQLAMAGRFVHHAKASRRVQVEKAELEQQVSALTGGLGYSNYQGMERAKQKIMAETAARECSVCFLENGEHEDWCKGQR